MLLPAALLLVAASAASVAAAGYTRHAGQIPTVRGGYFASLSAASVATCEARCTANATGCLGFTTTHGGDRCWLYPHTVKSLTREANADWWQKPGTPSLPTPPIPPPPPPPTPCSGPTCFSFLPDWKSGGPTTTLPTANFSVRKLEAIYYPPDGRIYAYVDIVNYTDIYYPASYSAEIGAYSSPDGFTNWSYHGIVVARGPKGGWDGGGLASPGAAVALDGSVVVGFAAENSPGGGINRGIGVAIAPHPLGPFVKQTTPIADPHTICGGTARCDDVIMQSRPGGELHIYHSVKGSGVGKHDRDGIRHRKSSDGGRTWGASTMVLSAGLQPGHEPAESIAGKFFPHLFGGAGAMVIITDGCKGTGCLHAYISKVAGDMEEFVPAEEQSLSVLEHPSFGPVVAPFVKGDWASQAGQIAFIPDKDGAIVGVSYSLWNGVPIREHREYHGKFAMSMGYTHTVYRVHNISR